ncbi:MAG TPA: hypothetical protein VN224_03290 [Xanthomonadales bacterium]|nr:hypothetical protein [Xanthomonadales bacterium]
MSADLDAGSFPPVDVFMAMSAVLTGVDSGALAGPLDPLGLAALLYATAQQNAGSDLTALLAKFQTIAATTTDPVAIGTQLLAPPDAETTYVARSVILEWYLGHWYTPASLRAYAKDPNNAPLDFFIISDDAYTNGWAWTIAQTKPMGYSNYSYGYWSSNPEQTLEELITDTPAGSGL